MRNSSTIKITELDYGVEYGNLTADELQTMKENNQLVHIACIACYCVVVRGCVVVCGVGVCMCSELCLCLYLSI
jgi:hypothetical protein